MMIFTKKSFLCAQRLLAGACGLLCLNATANPVAVENALPGNPPSEWDVSGSGDPSIQGFATAMSVNKGGTVQFKIKTTATAYQVKIYRLGYYNGNGARFITNILPSVSLPQSQPNPVTNSSVGLVDCGNWAVSASWTVPSNAVSGLYIARPTRTDTQGASHIMFVVRDDNGGSDIIFQTSDTTWHSYNTYGGNSLYGMYHTVGWIAGQSNRAYKISYNRPLTTRGTLPYYSFTTGEYPMIRWLEANGYNVSYISGIDTDRYPQNLTNNHKLFLSVGHDEYWSANQRTNITQARNAGLHLGFFSGNEMYWKIRWENSIDGSGTPYRTMVCYKETHAGAKIDPSSQWTGTWRDPRFSPPSDGGFPENEITGTLFIVNGIALNSLKVPEAFGKHRMWRNTTVATLGAGQTATFPAGILGFEWDEIADNGFGPPAQMLLSQTSESGLSVLADYGSTFVPGSATHHLSLYRHAGGALVFGAGTVHWGWGLDTMHANSTNGLMASNTNGFAADARLRQATVNLFADMGVQPGSLQPGLVPATMSTDFTAPVSVITNPAPGTTVGQFSSVQIMGTASDSGGGRPWTIEVSTDNGVSWRPASGRTNWTFTWNPGAIGTYVLRSRAVDDSGNLESPSSGFTVTVTNPPFLPGIVGNTADGLSSDNIYDGSPYINACRFTAASNVLVSAIRAKVQGVPGRYKCAIYTEATPGGQPQPNALVESTLIITNPATGWLTFPLNSLVMLTNANPYWLAVWSDDPNARAYYSDNSATLRWGQYAFGNWPDPLATSGQGNADYSIYATGGTPPQFVGTPTNRTIPELTLLTVTNRATDLDTAALLLTYSLLNAPSNAVISSSGVITWTPSAAQGPSTNTLITRVTDGIFSITNSFQVVVTDLNVAPIAFSQVLTNAEDTVLPVVLTFSDPDGPGTNFVLTALPTNGVLSGTAPNLSYLPNTNYFGADAFTFRVNDGTLTSAVATVSLLITNVNDAPTLPVLATVFAGVYQTVTISNVAADVDSGPELLSYSLLTAGGASIATNGIITWVPKSGPQTNFVTTQVQDGGLPVLSATNTVQIVITNAVEEPLILSLELVETNAILTWSAISNAPYRLQYNDDLATTNWVDVLPDVTAQGDTVTQTNTISEAAARHYRVVLLP